jgi:hypothetical protein
VAVAGSDACAVVFVVDDAAAGGANVSISTGVVDDTSCALSPRDVEAACELLCAAVAGGSAAEVMVRRLLPHDVGGDSDRGMPSDGMARMLIMRERYDTVRNYKTN